LKKCQIFQKAFKTVAPTKSLNSYIKAQFESPKNSTSSHFRDLNIATTKYIEIAYLCENVKKSLKQNVSQNVVISLSYFIFSKNHYYLPKVAQLVKIGQSGHSGCQQKQVFLQNLAPKFGQYFVFSAWVLLAALKLSFRYLVL
jgi:hypothetical protein